MLSPLPCRNRISLLMEVSAKGTMQVIGMYGVLIMIKKDQ